MKRFHIVAITTTVYHLLASYITFAEAKKDILSRSCHSYGVVLRDGNTGKRYCIAEIEAAQ